LVSPMASFPQASPPTPFAHLYPPPYALHALPISFVSILPPAQYWVRSTDHSANSRSTLISNMGFTKGVLVQFRIWTKGTGWFTKYKTQIYHGCSWNAASIKLFPCFDLHHTVSAHNPVGSHKKLMLMQSDW